MKYIYSIYYIILGHLYDNSYIKLHPGILFKLHYYLLSKSYIFY